KRELRGIRRANVPEPLGDNVERLVPLDLDEVGGAALASRFALQRLPELRRRILFHDPGGSLGAEHALVDRVVEIALDEADLVVLDGDLDAAAARAHVARAEMRLLPGTVVERDIAGHGRIVPCQASGRCG